ncbi:MAG TPA: nucleotidyltransferase family protein [Aquabacterium sp.]|uniref:nucleotidyltransferase family protein n=1 Tax=Aquabacterium sp. TaxID=1872578 RepID=UPI002E30F26B|nr:nucleotidyltransferase family protein [Aquabacterium sp.]HEX5358257.1 nucleotidyltransferase family protein [Aquabacterium sp.]
MSVAGLILAAGQGVRFGSDKRLAVLPEGRTMLEAALQPYAGLCAPLLVVIRPDDDGARDLALSCGAQVVTCADAASGMGHSLAQGARALMSMTGLDGVIIGLADMPLVTRATVQSLQQALLQTGQPVVPVYRGQLGQPRGLPVSRLADLALLKGDQGARHMLDWQRDAVPVTVDDAGVLFDVDRPEDLRTSPSFPDC